MNEITLEKSLSIWWSMIWRFVLISTLAGALLGFVGGLMVGMIGGSSELSGAVGALLGWLISIPVSMWALKAALSKKHGGYSVALVKPS